MQKYLIFPKYTSKQIDELPPTLIVEIIEIIWNDSINSMFADSKDSVVDSRILKIIDKLTFTSFDSDLKKLMNAKIKILPLLNEIELKNNDLPLNLRLLIDYKNHVLNMKSKKILSEPIFFELRNKLNLRYPISKLVLTEGITEEILLPKFAKRLNYNFDKHGVFVLGSGGKSKMPSLYSKLKKLVKIPIIMLLDYDACEISEFMKSNLLKKDKIILINNGEFEDIVSKNLIKRSFNNHFYDIEPVKKSELSLSESMCENIHNIYKSRGLGEFQKAHFAKILADNVSYKTDISAEIKNIINEVKSI